MVYHLNSFTDWVTGLPNIGRQASHLVSGVDYPAFNLFTSLNLSTWDPIPSDDFHALLYNIEKDLIPIHPHYHAEVISWFLGG